MAGTFFGGSAQGLEQFVIPIQTTSGTSRTQYLGNGVTNAYDIVFPYINPIHVNVLLGGVIIATTAWFFATPTRIQLYTPPASGLLVEIRRITPSAALVTFTNGAVLTADDLNMAATQALFLIQEANDLYAASLNGALVKVAGYGGPVTVSPAEMIAAVADQVLSSALVTSLNQRINDIDQNATAILNNAIAVDNINGIIDSLVGVGGVGTIIATETASRIAGDTALASQLTLLGAVNGAQTAFVLDTAHTYVDSSTSLATRLSGIDAYNASNAAAVVTETNARVSGDSSLASSITTLTSTVAGNTASIATNATTVSGLSAQYTVKVDVNGRVAGFGLASTVVNGTPLSDFVVIANKFSIVDPGSTGSAPVVPFIVTGGVVYMQNVVITSAVIQNLAVTTAKINNLAVGNGQIALLAVDTPQVASNAMTNVYLATNTFSGVTASGTTGQANTNISFLVGGTNLPSCSVIVTVMVACHQSAGSGTIKIMIGYDDTGGTSYTWSVPEVLVGSTTQIYTLQYQFTHSAANTGVPRVVLGWDSSSTTNVLTADGYESFQSEYIKK